MINIANRLAPYVDLDTDPERGVRLQSPVAAVDSEVATEPLFLTTA